MFYQIAIAEAKEGEMALLTCIEGQQIGSKALFHEGGLLTAIPQEAGAFWQQVKLPEDGFCGTFEGPDGSRLFCDPLVPEPKLILCGAGAEAEAVAALAVRSGFTVFVLDEDKSKLKEERFPECVLLDSFSGGLMPFSGGNCYFAVLTKDCAAAAKCLTTILRRRYAYVGLLADLASRPRWEQRLLEAEIPAEKIADLVLLGGESGEGDAADPQTLAADLLAQLADRRDILTGGVDCYIPIYQAIAQSPTPATLATVVKAAAGQGAKLCRRSDGSQVGSLSPDLEAAIADTVAQTAADGVPRLAVCNGTEIFVERI